ncbi:MAG: hypothetical protein HY556_09550 [Euryarchaeota archaeon]|nr:hypothetical protein [Euryarchaeota archaeon]
MAGRVATSTILAGLVIIGAGAAVYVAGQYGIALLPCDVKDPGLVKVMPEERSAFGKGANFRVDNASDCALNGQAHFLVVSRDGVELAAGGSESVPVKAPAAGRANAVMSWSVVAGDYEVAYRNVSFGVRVLFGPVEEVVTVNYLGAPDPASTLFLEKTRVSAGEDVRVSSRSALAYDWRGNFSLLVHKCPFETTCNYSEENLVYFSEYIPVDNGEWGDFTAIWDQTATDGTRVEPGIYHLFIVIDWRPGDESEERKATVVFGMSVE